MRENDQDKTTTSGLTSDDNRYSMLAMNRLVAAINRYSGSSVMATPFPLRKVQIRLSLKSSEIANATSPTTFKDIAMNYINGVSVSAKAYLASPLPWSEIFHKAKESFGGGSEEDCFLKKLDIALGVGIFGGAVGLLVLAPTEMSNFGAYFTGMCIAFGFSWAASNK